MCHTHNARPCPCGGASRSHPCYSSRSPPCRCIPSIRHVIDVWLCSEWIVPHTEKHPCIRAKNLFKLSVEKVKISTFSEYCNLHSKTLPNKAYMSALNMGSVFISLLASRRRCFLCTGSRWLNTLAAAGGKIRLGYLWIAASMMSHGPWILLDVTWNTPQCLYLDIYLLCRWCKKIYREC